MTIINSPLVRTFAVACVLAHPTLEELVPPQLFMTPFARVADDCGCGQQDEAGETQREREQRLDDVFKALEIRAGAVVADVGAGRGFYTVRLARAVGDTGKVYAIDISSSALRDLRKRVEREGIGNVDVVEGAADNPRLPDAALDAVLIVNAYHEMTEHQAMLEGIRRALKPTGRLVILEPISSSRRTSPRRAQTSQHEISPEFVLADAREAGFSLASLEEQFARRSGHETEWLMVLTP
jgi:ubiquinone/menaquinone biosynthesis C-methylase UbiE